MPSKRSHEGYLLLDDREAGGKRVECPTITCSHCQQVFMVNPLRNRPRAYCPKCDHYVCDKCGALRALNGGQCKTFRQLIDEVQESADKGLTPPTILLP